MRNVAEHPSWPRNVDADGFEIAWGDVDDEAAGFALGHFGEAARDFFYMPVGHKFGARIDGVEAFFDEGSKVAAKDGVD